MTKRKQRSYFKEFKSRENLSPSTAPLDYNSMYKMDIKFVITFYYFFIFLYVINR